jgi:hypothetical protein
MLHLEPRHRTAGPAPAATAATVLVVTALLAALPAPPAAAQGSSSDWKVHAYTLEHQPSAEALALIRPLLSPVGTLEEQPRSNTVVIRDRRQFVERIIATLEKFDHPPEELRFDIRIVRAGPKRQVISPPSEPAAEDAETLAAESGLPEELVTRLRELLRYDDYRVLASAAMSSREGEEVAYSLGGSYKVSFRSGTLLAGPAGQRVRLEGFRILERVDNPANKGRQLEPKELFHATLNLWIDRPFNLVLAQDESRQEALMVAITCRREAAPSSEP